MDYEFIMYFSDICFVIFFILYLLFKSHVKFLLQAPEYSAEGDISRQIGKKKRWIRVFMWLWIASFVLMAVSLTFGLKQ